VTAPIDIECPVCQSSAGNCCTSATVNPRLRQGLASYHAGRIDAAFRETTRRHHDPRALRDALRETVDRLAKHQTTTDELSFIITIRETFAL